MALDVSVQRRAQRAACGATCRGRAASDAIGSQFAVAERGAAGKFLNGALEKVGKKIDDTVQISRDLTARYAKS